MAGTNAVNLLAAFVPVICGKEPFASFRTIYEYPYFFQQFY